MSDLINRSAVIAIIEKYCMEYDLRDLLIEVEVLPTAHTKEQCENCHYRHIWMTQRMNGLDSFGHGGATA